jgi:NADH dehydrogenase
VSGMPPEQKQVVIVGAGYGGLLTALRLETLLKHTPNWRILLIDKFNYHQLKTEIHKVAAGRISPKTASIPIAELIRGKKIEFLQAEVTRVNFTRQVLTTNRGEIPYNILVLATGSEARFFGIPGMNQYSFTLSSVEDAVRINNHIHDMFTQARIETNDAKRKALVTVVVGGGGFTGVELATELAHHMRRLSEQFYIPSDQVELIVVEARGSVLPGFDTELVERAQRVMKREGIKLKLNTPCILAEPDAITLSTGEVMPTYTTVWTGGIKACVIAAQPELKRGASGRIVINPFLESVDHQEVYAVGDSALILDPLTQRPFAPTAQLAIQQAEVVALNIYADIKHLKRVRYIPKIVGQFVSLGGKDAVGWAWQFRVTGFIAWLLKRMTLVRYLYSIGGVKLAVQRFRYVFLT